jgi:phosphoribosylformimino-5-aminoimidazole carboxamide ribotide isomerase
MEGFQIIPAIDLMDGKCVRLTQGDFERKSVYSCDPLEMAKLFESRGIKRLHLVDLDGARARRVVNHKILEEIATKTSLCVDFSGGISTDQDIEKAFSSGAQLICVGSIAYRDEPLFTEWLEKYGPAKIILAADVKNKRVVISGWAENTSVQINEHVAKYVPKGLQWCMTTDITKDGLLAGPSFSLYQEMIESFPTVSWIASGGVSSINDVEELNKLGATGVIIGKALYERRIMLEDLEPFIN